ncbi:MAG: hypothetical protein KDC34_05640 [Saprospiraceae bacterium]|nr:hypothetical protein [Saprospiraceae bacterium]
MKKILLAFALMAACVMYTTEVSASATTTVAPDPTQKIIEKLNGWTTLTQGQMDQIAALSANYDWDSITTPEAFRVQLKLLKADIRGVVGDVQFQQIKDSQGGN